MSFQPEIHFDYLEHEKWINKPLSQLYKEMDELRKKVKVASGYTWDNSHFFINSIYGRPALQVGFYNGSISFWNAETGTSIDSFSEFGREESNKVNEWISHIEKHEIQCNDCGEWVKKSEEGQYYSFAGFVCNKCYNPKVHLPPNTKGDS
jgi:hypothetical protein